MRSITPADESALVTAWRELLARHAAVACELDRTLGEFGLGVSEFELLDQLAERPDGTQRMQELSEAVHLSQSALSRLVSRLERDHLVTRATCPDDRRCATVTLTTDGRDRHAAALPTQRAVLASGLRAGTQHT